MELFEYFSTLQFCFLCSLLKHECYTTIPCVVQSLLVSITVNGVLTIGLGRQMYSTSIKLACTLL